MFILFKKTDFDTILACFGGTVYRGWRSFFSFFLPPKGGGLQYFDADFLINLGPLSEDKTMLSPLKLYCKHGGWWLCDWVHTL